VQRLLGVPPLPLGLQNPTSQRSLVMSPEQQLTSRLDPRSPKELADLIATDIKRWSDVIEKAGIERI